MGAATVSFDTTEVLTDDEIYERLRAAWSGDYTHSGSEMPKGLGRRKKGCKWKHIAKATTAERATELLAAHVAKGRKTRLIPCGTKYQPQVYM